MAEVLKASVQRSLLGSLTFVHQGGESLARSQGGGCE
jgi:hypothetical protein